MVDICSMLAAASRTSPKSGLPVSTRVDTCRLADSVRDCVLCSPECQQLLTLPSRANLTPFVECCIEEREDRESTRRLLGHFLRGCIPPSR